MKAVCELFHELVIDAEVCQRAARAPKTAPRSGLWKSTPISKPQKLPETSPDAVELTTWPNCIWPSMDLVLSLLAVAFTLAAALLFEP